MVFTPADLPRPESASGIDRTFRLARFLVPVVLVATCLGPLAPTAPPILADTGSALETEVEAPTTTPVLRAYRIEEPIVVDGVLDDPAWTLAESSAGFTQREPEQYMPATEETEIRVVYTSETLYVGVLARDRNPTSIIGRELGLDVPIFRDDGIVLLLDTFLDRRNAYFFETNPVGSRTDGLVTDEGRDFSTDWDGIWDVRSRQSADGWVAEFAIPFRTLRFDANIDSWGLQVRRIIRHRNEITFWSPIGRDAGLFRLSKAGTLTGLENLDSGRDLQVKPFFTAVAREEDDDAGIRQSSDDTEVGLDLKWGVGRGLVLDLTANTDFAETEVDNVEVNLTRFSLFFPEKREFFLENAGIFRFGPSVGSKLNLFFSRRIGIARDGRQVDLDLGARLAGRVGDWSIGVLGVRTGPLGADPENDLDAVPENDWGTVRLKRNLGERSNVGMLLTHREGSDGSWNRVLGLDGEWKPNDNLSLWAYGAASTGPDDESEGGTGGVGARYSGEDWSWDLGALEIDDTFDPQTGFVRRRGTRNYFGEVEWRPRSANEKIRNYSFELESEVFTRQDGTVETVDLNLDLLGVRFESDDYVSLFTQYRYERLFEDFEIFEDVVIARDEYEWVDVGLFAGSSDSRPFSVRGFVVAGDFWDGQRLAWNVTFRVRPSRFFQASTTWAHNDIEAGTGEFETNVVRQRLRVAVSPTMGLDAFLQYNDAAENTALNLRFAWQYRPGSDLFVVYNHGWDAPGIGDLSTRDRQVIVKMTYTWQL